MRVIDRWQTQHGSWDVNAHNQFGIDQAHRDKYLAGRDIPGAGGDHHIFVRLPEAGDKVLICTADGENSYTAMAPFGNTWVSLAIFGASGYNPGKGEKGPWRVIVNGVIVADGIGLPNGEHVSTFLVIGEGDPVPAPSGKDVYKLYRNEVLVYQSEG